jgi:hypothetical protein
MQPVVPALAPKLAVLDLVMLGERLAQMTAKPLAAVVVLPRPGPGVTDRGTVAAVVAAGMAPAPREPRIMAAAEVPVEVLLVEQQEPPLTVGLAALWKLTGQHLAVVVALVIMAQQVVMAALANAASRRFRR